MDAIYAPHGEVRASTIGEDELGCVNEANDNRSELEPFTSLDPPFATSTKTGMRQISKARDRLCPPAAVYLKANISI
jgi:hypothetical protein